MWKNALFERGKSVLEVWKMKLWNVENGPLKCRKNTFSNLEKIVAQGPPNIYAHEFGLLPTRQKHDKTRLNCESIFSRSCFHCIVCYRMVRWTSVKFGIRIHLTQTKTCLHVVWLSAFQFTISSWCSWCSWCSWIYGDGIQSACNNALQSAQMPKTCIHVHIASI